MLKFRFPTKRNQENNNNNNNNINHQETHQQIKLDSNQKSLEQHTNTNPSSSSPSTPTPSQSPIRNHLNPSYPPTINQPNFVQSTDSINPNHPSEDYSLPINLTSSPSIHQIDPSNSLPPTSSSNPLVSRKIRRKSYGGLRAMLGINRQEDHPPPLPIPPASASSTNSQHQQNQQIQQHLHQHHRHNPSLDASCPSSSSSTSNFPLPSSPIVLTSTPSDHPIRPTSSSLRPFPFLGGIRRKSANTNSNKSSNTSTTTALPFHTTTPHPTTPSPTHPSSTHDDRAPSPSSTTLASVTVKTKTKTLKINSGDRSTRFYTNGSSKKAQSVDDLSQFGFLPKQRIQPRRSEELFEIRPTGVGKLSAPPCSSTSSSTSSDRVGERSDHPSDLHNGLDQIGELAGSLAGMRGSSKSDDRQPRLSNPKGMRTVYGVPIEDLYWRDGEAFPLLVNVLVKLIEQEGLDQQGIYRVPGEKRVIESLQASIDEKGVHGVDIWKDCFKDVHNLSGALKLFLREIPGGVIPFDRYDRFLAVNAIADDAERTSRLQAHVKDLPIPNKVLLLKLVKHFERVVAHAEANSMLAHNVAIVFAPSLFRNGSEHSNPLLSMQNIGKASAIVRHFVLNASKIFEETSEELIKQSANESNAAQAEANQSQPPTSIKRDSCLSKLSHQRHDSQEMKKSKNKNKEDEPHKRGSMSSVQTNETIDEAKKVKRGSMSANRKKQSTTSSTNSTSSTVNKRNQSSNTSNNNNGLRRNSKSGKARHSLTSSILNSPITNSPLCQNHILPQNLASSSNSTSATFTRRPQTGIDSPSPTLSSIKKK